MISVIGDVHRSFGILEAIISKLPRSVRTVIQVGDLGLTGGDVRMSKARRPALRVPSGKRLYWIDGNWDDFGGFELSARTEPTEMLPGIVYVPRGTVLSLDGQRIGFLGGAESIMTETRYIGQDWWPNLESVKDADVSRLLEQATVTRGIDLLISHTPPRCVTPHSFPISLNGRLSRLMGPAPPATSSAKVNASVHASTVCSCVVSHDTSRGDGVSTS